MNTINNDRSGDAHGGHCLLSLVPSVVTQRASRCQHLTAGCVFNVSSADIYLSPPIESQNDN